MRGYKGTDADGCCRGFQYHVGLTYEMNGELVELCERGFHFCRKLRDTYSFYDPRNGCRFFEVEAHEVYTDGEKSVSDRLTLVRELEPVEVWRAFYGDGYGDGYGNGNGNGYGDGYGNGYGYGYGINKILLLI